MNTISSVQMTKSERAIPASSSMFCHPTWPRLLLRVYASKSSGILCFTEVRTGWTVFRINYTHDPSGGEVPRLVAVEGEIDPDGRWVSLLPRVSSPRSNALRSLNTVVSLSIDTLLTSHHHFSHFLQRSH